MKGCDEIQKLHKEKKMYKDTSTGQYQVTGNGSIWGIFNNPIEASNHAQALTKELIGSFHVKDLNPPTDEEIMEEFSHLDFGVPAQNHLPASVLTQLIPLVLNFLGYLKKLYPI
ncbi:MAG: hypothetical protein K0U54_09070 [Bacteroidetes bacterium]|nr:hypothetical protein [Bacteroidota bacterium]